MLKALFFLVSMLVSSLKERRQLALEILVLVSEIRVQAMIWPAAMGTSFSSGVLGLSSCSRFRRVVNLVNRRMEPLEVSGESLDGC